MSIVSRSQRVELLIVMAFAARLYAQTSISFPRDFPAKPVTFQQYNTDTRTFLPLRFAGNLTVGPNGDIRSTGPVYTSQTNFFPNVMLDLARNTFFLHPGTFATVKNAAVVSVGVPAAGTYDVSGAFARANDFRNAGDGVRVVAFLNNQFGSPLFDAVISSNNVVNPSSFFTGTGVAPFHFSVGLAQGDTIQFAVSSGPSLLDGTFDFTALQFTINGGGGTVSLPADFPPKPILFQEYDSGPGKFVPLRFAGNRTMGPNGSISSTGPVYWSQSRINTFPYLMLDTARNLFLLGPGTFGTAQNAAAVSAGISTAGTYDISGAFARANDFRNAGDGVRVVGFVDNLIGAPLFDTTISSDNAVDPNNPFGGTGVAPFHFTVPLAQGDAVQFAVFSGPNLLDGTFDFTALQFTITAVTPDRPRITAPLDGARPRSMYAAISGTAQPSARVAVWLDGVVSDAIDVDAGGNWERVFFAGPGSHELRVQYEGDPGTLSDPVHFSTTAISSPPLVNPNVFLKLRKADIILTFSLRSPQIALYGPQHSHAALFVGGDLDGTPIVAEAVTADESGGLGQVRAVPLELSTVYTDGRLLELYRPSSALSAARRQAIAGWARGVATQGLSYWSIPFDFVTPFSAAALLWDFQNHRPKNDARFQQALNNINAKKLKTNAFICSTLVWRAYFEGTSRTLDLSQPNNIVIQPASVLGNWIGDPAFIDRLRPNFVFPDTLGLSPQLTKVP